MDPVRQSEIIRLESDRLADVAAGAKLTDSVPTCPGWTLGDLVRHVYAVHEMWRETVTRPLRTGADVDAFEQGRGGQPPDDVVLERFRVQAHAFASDLAAADPHQPCWTWGASQTAGFVQRFQVQEASIHRADAELAAGLPVSPMQPDAALDGLDVLCEVLAPWVKEPPAPVALRANEDAANPRVLFGDAADVVATLHGRASDLVYAAWFRLPLETVEVSGDRAAADAALGAIDHS